MLAEIEQFVNWARRRSPNARTWKDYNYDLRQFAALVGDVPPAAITFLDIDRFVDTQKTRGFQPTTINRRLATIISLYTFLGDEDPTLVCPVLPRRITCASRNVCPDRCKRIICMPFLPPLRRHHRPKGNQTTGCATGQCSCSCCAAG